MKKLPGYRPGLQCKGVSSVCVVAKGRRRREMQEER